VVDVGCAWGVLARLIHEEFGCEVYGVEPSRAAANYARAQGVEIIASTAEAMGQTSSLQGRVDLVIFHTSLRNVNDIEVAMEQTRKLLKPAGLIYIKTGNYMWNNRLVRFNNYAFVPENLQYFLERNGFKVLWMESAPHPSQTSRYDKSNRFMSVCARRAPDVVATFPALDCDQVIAEAQAGRDRSLAEAS
jgi:2-polyprenyl-3-methyl-5-hydroxy-6-metoxy-1,4-benzoquinol methylase